MLEIFLIIAISKKIAAILKEKGRSPTGYVVLFVFLWFGGEIIGAIAGFFLAVAMDPGAFNDGFSFVAYLFALVGAAVGALVAYSIANAVPAIEEPHRRDFDDDADEDEEDRRRENRRRRRSEDDAFEDPERRR